MEIKLKIDGLDELRKQFAGFSDRRFAAGLATGLTRTAKAGVGMLQERIDSGLDRPNPRTQSAVAFKSASASKLEAEVFVKDWVGKGNGTAPVDYLMPQFGGGNRLVKKFEQALINGGVMPKGYVTVPGKAAKLDSYGNVSRAQIVAVLAVLGRELSPGYQQVISKSTEKRIATAKRRGLEFFVVRPEERRVYRLDPGIYIWDLSDGGRRKAVFIFRRAALYRQRLSLQGRLEADIQRTAVDEIGRGLRESAARLAAKGGV